MCHHKAIDANQQQGATNAFTNPFTDAPFVGHGQPMHC